MRATLTTLTAAALLAAGAGSAAARPADLPVAHSDAARHAQAVRTQPVNHLGGDRPTVASPAQPAPAPIVRVARAPLADGGFDWADAGIGAGLSAALLLGAAGVAVIRRPPMTTAR